MLKPASKQTRVTPNPSSREASFRDASFIDGMNRALELLAELSNMKPEDCESDHWPYLLDPSARSRGGPQVNIVLSCLDEIRKQGNRVREEGFAAVLTDCLSMYCNLGCERDAGSYAVGGVIEPRHFGGGRGLAASMRWHESLRLTVPGAVGS